MSIDLEQELARVAGSVHDDAAAERMSGQVRTMVGRIKRRRAARHTAQGMVGIGAVAAVVLGGAQLAGRPGTVAPPAASTDPTATAEPSQCGATVTDPDPEAGSVVGLAVEVVPDLDGSVDSAEVTVSFTGQVDEIATLEGDPQLVITQDGVVVSQRATLSSIVQSKSALPSYSFSQSPTACSSVGAPGARLPAGEYELRATQWVTFPDSARPVQLVGTAPLIIAGSDGSSDGAEPTQPGADLTGEELAKAQVERWLAAPEANPAGVFPRCGTRAYDVIDDGMPALELDLLADPTALAEPGGATVPDAVVLKTTEGRYAIGNAAPLARLVLLSDGVVVGYQFLDSEELVTIDLADGETMPFDLRTTTALCGTGEGGQGEELPLPAGEYTAIASLDILVKEIGGPGEEPDGRTYPVTAVSEPVTVRIG